MSDLDQQVVDLVADLVEPRQHSEPRYTWDRHRNKKFLGEHITLQPGLLTQLHRRSVDPERWINEVGGGDQNKPCSRPPLGVEAFSRWLEIGAAAATWCGNLGLQLRIAQPTAEDYLRALAQVAGDLEVVDLESLVRDLRTWRRWAVVMTGWATKEIFVPTMTCPTCLSFRSIRISLLVWEGFCSQCQHYWDNDADIRNLAGKAIAQKQAA